MDTFSTDLYTSRQTGTHTLTQQAFMLSISVFTTMNIGVAAFGSSVSYGWQISSGLLAIGFMLACLAASVGGAVLAHSNDDPMTSIVGGFMCAGAMGLMVGPYIALFPMGTVLQAFAIAACVVALTGMIGAFLPQDLSSWGAPLFAGILGLIGLTLLGPLLGPSAVTVIDYGAILLFSAVMVYDLNMAQRLDRTMDNAIDVAVNVFLNFANIFIRVLALLGDDD